jgi:hypothetical protein
MSAGQIAAPRIQVRPPLMAAALVATFAIGLGSGLVLPRALDSGGRSPAVAAAVTTSASNGYQLFRQGERADLVATSASNGYQLFRQGERADLVATSASNGYQLFRQGERADLAIPSAVDANRLFRQGERAP